MTHSIEEHSEQIHLPKPTFWPLVLGLGLGMLPFGVILLDRKLVIGGQTMAFTLGQGLLVGGLFILLLAIGGWVWSNIRAQVHAPELAGVETTKFAIWCFLGTEIIIFGVLIARVIVVWAHDPAAHKILTQPVASLLLVSLNTFLLLMSSLAMVLGLSGIQRGSRRALVGWLAAVALLGIAFLSIQGYEYTKLFHEGLSLTCPSNTPPDQILKTCQFGSAFFFLTGNHGLHVFIGVIWCLLVILRALGGGFNEHDYQGVEIFGLYWHFVDVVWIMIFTLVYLMPG